MAAFDENDLLPTNKAAKVLNVSVSFLNKTRCTGGGPKFLKIGRSVRYRYADLLSFMAAQTRRSTSEDQAA